MRRLALVTFLALLTMCQGAYAQERVVLDPGDSLLVEAAVVVDTTFVCPDGMVCVPRDPDYPERPPEPARPSSLLVHVGPDPDTLTIDAPHYAAVNIDIRASCPVYESAPGDPWGVYGPCPPVLQDAWHIYGGMVGGEGEFDWIVQSQTTGVHVALSDSAGNPVAGEYEACVESLFGPRPELILLPRPRIEDYIRSDPNCVTFDFPRSPTPPPVVVSGPLTFERIGADSVRITWEPVAGTAFYRWWSASHRWNPEGTINVTAPAVTVALGEDLNPGDWVSVRPEPDGETMSGVYEPAVPIGSAHPNEPPGFAVIAESDFDCLPGDGCEAHGEWTSRRNANMTLVPSTAPEQP